MNGQMSVSAALSGVYCVADAEKLRGQREMTKLIKVLSNIKVFKTSDEVLSFLADKGFVTSDLCSWSRTVKMRAENLEVEIKELKENNVDYVVNCRSVETDA
jgi:nicotinic acid phosphoribosyltransferase